MFARRRRLLVGLVLLMGLGALAGLVGSRLVPTSPVNKRNYDAIQQGWPRADVAALLGEPITAEEMQAIVAELNQRRGRGEPVFLTTADEAPPPVGRPVRALQTWWRDDQGIGVVFSEDDRVFGKMRWTARPASLMTFVRG